MQYSVNQSFHLNPFLINLGEKNDMLTLTEQWDQSPTSKKPFHCFLSCVAFNRANVSSCIKAKSVILLFLYFLNNDPFFFPLKLYFRIEKTTSRRSPSAFQNVKKFSVLKGSPSPVAFPWWPHFFTVQVSSEADGELFHSWKKQVKYKHTSTCYIKLWEEKSTLGKYQATYFMIFKCHSFVQYWLFYMVVEL